VVVVIEEVAVVALPFNAAVMVPAEKLPEASRSTSVFGVLAVLPVVAVFATLPAVLIVANFESAMAAVALISELIIELVRFSFA